MQARRPLRVKAWILRRPDRVMALAGSLEPLFDARREGLRAAEWWQPGTYYSHPARAVAVVIVLRPRRPCNLVGLGRVAARILEVRKGLVLDWAAAAQKGSVWLLVKTWAADQETGRGREFRLELRDIRILAGLVQGWENGEAVILDW